MSGWVWMDHPDTEAGPARFPDDPDVVAVQEARGWVQVDEPGASPEQGEVTADEVDDRGQGWVYVQHPDFDTVARVPVEGFAGFRDKGWTQTTAQVQTLEEHTVPELKAEAKAAGLPTSGTKQDLIDRLSEPVEPEPSEEQ